MFILFFDKAKGKTVNFMFKVFMGGIFFLWSSCLVCFANNDNVKTMIETRISIPYHGHLASEPVIQIAEAAAILSALDEVRNTFSETSLVKLGARTKYRQLALASAMYPVIIYERRTQDGPEIFIKACCHVGSVSSEEYIRKLIRQPDLLQLRELAIKRFEECVNEGKDLLDQSCNCTSVLCGQSPSILSQIKKVSNRIKALHIYFLELNAFDSTWTKPDQTVLALSEAMILDPDNTLLLLGIGECLVLLNRPYEGIKVLQKIALNSELHARVLYMQGMASLQMYLPALAIKDITYALELDAEHPEWWNALGIAKLLSGDTKDMCGDFYQACAMGDCDGLIEVRKQNFCLEYSGI